MECWGDDLDAPWITLKFPKAVEAKKTEAVVFSFIVYTSKKHRDSVNKKVMSDPAMKQYEGKKMPFDMKRMAFGGFTALVDL